MNKKPIDSKKKFALSENPVDYILSVHVRNLMATYGEEKVRQSMKDLFLTETKKNKKQAVGQ